MSENRKSPILSTIPDLFLPQTNSDGAGSAARAEILNY